MKKADKEAIINQQIEMFKNQEIKDIKNQKVLIMDNKALKETVKSLKEMDFGVVKDDFGVKGYSNEGLMLATIRLNRQMNSIIIDNSYFDGTRNPR